MITRATAAKIRSVIMVVCVCVCVCVCQRRSISRSARAFDIWKR